MVNVPGDYLGIEATDTLIQLRTRGDSRQHSAGEILEETTDTAS